MFSLKWKTKQLIRNNKVLYKAIRLLYTAVFHRERFLKRTSFGSEHPDKIILVIRPISEDGIQGLMSLLVQAARWIQYADEHDHLVFIDYKTYKTQYYDGKNNAWEFFFEQPDGLQHETVYKSRNVILSGVSLKKTTDDAMFRESVFTDRRLLEKCHTIMTERIRLTEEVRRVIDEENALLHVEDCIGVYIRGTDYARLRPTGEFCQPSIQDMCGKISEFIGMYPGKRIFLVTEDEEYYQTLKSVFTNQLVTVSFDYFVSGYDGKGYLSSSGLLENNRKKRGMDYLVKIVLLSRCRYLVSSITMGSIAAYCFNGGIYDDKYIFDLGYYE